MSRILVTGGAGYIGTHLVNQLLILGFAVNVLDDLSNANHANVPKGVVFFKGSLLNEDLVAQSLQGVDTVIHLAAKKSVQESVKKPDLYFEINSMGTKFLLDAMRRKNIKKLIFSSTAAVYDFELSNFASETTALNPISPYGQSKLLGEEHIETYVRMYGVNAVIFRYFNVVGFEEMYRMDVSNNDDLFSSITKSIISGQRINIFGNSFNSKDGTAVRDFIHVSDLVQAHIDAIQSFTIQNQFRLFNVGVGVGNSVLEVVNEFERQVNCPLEYDFEDSRAADIPISVADSSKILLQLGWRASRSLSDMVGCYVNLVKSNR
jgi:UDP-glucose 4-epimerase